jgi:dTDP-4-amino-4,6-dideoxygalactose transaminase
VYEEKHPKGFKWLHESFGTNWRITEMQSALGRIQLGRLADWSEKRRANAMRIWSAAGKCAELRVPEIPDYIEHAAYKCYVFVNQEALRPGWSRDKIMKRINELAVPCYSGSCSEVYLEKAFDTVNCKPAASLPVARALGETSLMFLVHPTLSNDEVDQTCAAIRNVMQEASS